jgi:hypothetical protein
MASTSVNSALATTARFNLVLMDFFPPPNVLMIEAL